jgi:hypothetical protein
MHNGGHSLWHYEIVYCITTRKCTNDRCMCAVFCLFIIERRRWSISDDRSSYVHVDYSNVFRDSCSSIWDGCLNGLVSPQDGPMIMISLCTYWNVEYRINCVMSSDSLSSLSIAQRIRSFNSHCFRIFIYEHLFVYNVHESKASHIHTGSCL